MTRPNLFTADALRRTGRRLDRLIWLTAALAVFNFLGFTALGLLLVGLAVG